MGQAKEQLGHTDRARGAYTRVLKDYRDWLARISHAGPGKSRCF
jgi:hypothetical protein